MNNIPIHLLTLKGLRKLVALCKLNDITYEVLKCENPYKVLIPEQSYRIFGFDEMKFE
jgi:hypothetical protein